MIVLLVLGLVLLIISGVRYWQRGRFHWVTIVTGIILVVFSGIGIHLTQSQHFGMSKIPVEKTQKIDPATSLMGYKIIATNNSHSTAEVYTYRRDGKTYQTTDSDKRPSVKKIVGKQGVLNTTMNTYQVTSPWQQILLVGMPTMIKGESYTKIEIPQDWYVINQNDLISDQKFVTEQSKQIPNKVASETTKAIQDAAKDDDSVLTDKGKQKDLQDKAISDVTNQVNDETKQALAKRLNQQTELK
ncbi:hypothetical protein WOSG25_011470 [Weissella oryzae SG25]|uniref:DUF4811 domain-containing protein n=1 Tax=Weissella oryzae (strain DSM 25784 / JCM 18191 / LMG 30913 / SG25) TaxID=1329250 RepID=A0A069CQT0_WEIOS|nr:hypothetical protein WOSG25_011470 [Weissella oryzae SG25]